MLTEQTLGGHLRRVRMGKYALLTRCYRASLASGFNLRTVTTEELETIPGFGQKSSRFFILHSRPGANVAVIDTHMLKYLRAIEAPNVPKTIPSGKDYTRLEELLLQKAKSLGLKMAEFDLNIWKWYADNKTGIPEFPAI
jgi:thermostable 8-oxoguanine DNA glycosylase